MKQFILDECIWQENAHFVRIIKRIYLITHLLQGEIDFILPLLGVS